MTFASPLLTRTAIAFAFLFLAVYALTFFDARLLYGVSVWEKPSKFFLSLAIHMATLAWGISLLSAEQRRSRGILIASLAFIAAAVFEMAYMTYQSSLGEASHFNRSTTFHDVMYSLMGMGALTLTVTTAYLGWRIRRAGTTPMHFAAGWSFIVSAVATTPLPHISPAAPATGSAATRPMPRGCPSSTGQPPAAISAWPILPPFTSCRPCP